MMMIVIAAIFALAYATTENFIPRIWSAQIFRRLREAHVFGSLANRNYEGEFSQGGDSVQITAVGRVSVSDYSGSVSAEDLEDAGAVLEIEKDKYYAFKVDDLDRRQANADFVSEAMDEAGYSLSEAVDDYIAGLYGSAGSSVGSANSATSITNANFITVMAQVAEALDEQNVPQVGRWCVIPPWLKRLGAEAGVFDMKDPEAYSNGQLTRVMGFDFRMSNSVSNSAGTYRVMAGTSRAITFAEQLVKTEAYRDQDSFSDIVRGRHVYGAKVIDPEALCCLYCEDGS